MSFPPGTEMFQFPGFALIPLLNSENKYLRIRRQRTETESRIASVLCLLSLDRLEVGFPIRKFTDQSLFAAPHDLSQRTTSFIASQRQGIHQIPLRHLIALIAKARSRAGSRNSEDGNQNARTFRLPISDFRFPSPWRFEKTSFASNASGDLSGQAPNPRLVAYQTTENRRQRTDKSCLLASVVRRPITECASSSQCQISKDRGRTTENGTLSSAARPSSRQALSRSTKLIKCIGRMVQERRRQQRDRPSSVVCPPRPRMVEPDGIEPTTSCLQSTRSPN